MKAHQPMCRPRSTMRLPNRWAKPSHGIHPAAGKNWTGIFVESNQEARIAAAKNAAPAAAPARMSQVYQRGGASIGG